MARPKTKKDPKTLFGKRLNYLFNGKNFLDFERKHGLSNGQISKFIDGVEPRLSAIEAIIKGTGCNAAWLITGEGEPFPDAKDDKETEQ